VGLCEMLPIRALSGAVALVVLSLSVVSHAQLFWGVTGHALVADIAQAFLDSSSQKQVNYLLSAVNGSMAAVASWADEIRSQKEYKWSATLHYINTPDWLCNYNHQRDCTSDGMPNFCVAGAISNYTNRLTENLSFFQLNEALKFLIHFVGDIHQPLHVGFTTDEGGNTLKGDFEGKSDVLHAIWDGSILGKRMKDNFNNTYDAYLKYLLNEIATVWKNVYPQWITCSPPSPDNACSDQWGSESIQFACNYSYVEADGKTHIQNHFNLGDDYYNRNYPIVDLQIAKAGSRLASIINSLFT